MTIAYDQIPANLRLPGHFIEFDSSMAGSSTRMAKLVVFGNMLAGGAATPLTAYQLLDADTAGVLFGRGSMLHAMLRRLLLTRPAMQVWAIGAVDDGAATAATCEILVTASSAQAGVLPLYINNDRIRVAVAGNDSAEAIAQAMVAAVNAQADAEMTAAYLLDGADHKVVLTSKQKCEAANDIQVAVAIAEGESVPAGVTLTLGAVSGGTANPDITDVLGALGDEWYNYFVNPWTDATNMAALETELDNRWGALVQKDGRAFIAYRAGHAATLAFGDARNSPHVACLGTNEACQAAYLWAASFAMVAANALWDDPARPLKTLPLPGLRAPAREDRWDDTARNLLLFDGISTYTVNSAGQVVLEKVITQYQENASGFDDDALLSINTPETLGRIRYEQRARAARDYPRHKLASDGTEYPPGQPIVTPLAFKGMLIALYKELVDKGWVEDVAHYMETLLVERDADNKNRINYVDEPNLVNQFEIAAGRMRFRN